MVRPLVGSSPALVNLDRAIQGGPPSICINRFNGGIGDVLMTTPAVKAIAKKYQCKVDYATDLHYLDGALEKVLRYNPYIGKVFSAADLPDMRDQYSAIVDFGCPCVVHEQPKAIPVNRIDLFARYARLQLTDFHVDYVITEEERQWADDIFYQHNLTRKTNILVQPFSSSIRRDAPIDVMQTAMRKVLQQIKANLLVITHDSDNIKDRKWDWPEVLPLHNFDIRQLAAIMERCDLVLCPDSSILHLAGALDKPTVTLFGPTDPRARVNYYPEAIAIWPGGRLSCSPCWYNSDACNNRCVCWKQFDVEEVALTILAKLNNSALPFSDNLVFFPKKEVSSDFQLL